MNMKRTRKTFTKANKALREARREYIDQKRHQIIASKDDDVINHVAFEMIELGLYAKPVSAPNWRDFRFAIARAIYRIERETWGVDVIGEWWFWLSRNGFDSNFGRKVRQSA